MTPDNGLSAPYNSFFTFFGQFFDHGLDKITTNAVNGHDLHSADAGRSAVQGRFADTTS